MRRVSLRWVLFAGLACAAIGGGAQAQAATVAPPPGALVERVRASGTGCPDPDDVSVAFSPDGGSLVVGFGPGQLAAEVGPEVPEHALSRSCRIQLDLAIPPGYQMSIDEAIYQAHGDLDFGVLARHTTRYSFQGTRAPARVARNVGPHSGAYTVSSQFGPAAVWSGCGVDRRLTLQTSVGVTNVGNPQGYGYVDGGGSTGLIVYNLSWSRCLTW